MMMKSPSLPAAQERIANSTRAYVVKSKILNGSPERLTRVTILPRIFGKAPASMDLPLLLWN
jgi:hypothetical protein